MSRTLQTLLAIFIFLGISLSMAWIHFRNKGLSRPISPVRHAFFDENPTETKFLIAYQGAHSSGLPNSVAAMEGAARLHPRIILWTDVQMTSDNILVVYEPRRIAGPEGKQTLVPFLKFEELKKQAGPNGLISLRDLLGKIPGHRFIINIRDYRPGLDMELAKLIDDLNASDRILVQSEQDGILRDMRAARATWLYGSSQAQITQLLMLIPFGLEGMAPLKADVYITPAIRSGAWIINPDVVTEIHRRNRKVFAGPVETKEDAARLREMGVDGLITPRPEDHLSFLE